MTNSQTSITQGSITKSLLFFFFPIFAGTLLQLLYNTADTIILGQFCGSIALAATGGETAQLINLLTAFLTGLSSGAGIIMSQFFGEKKAEECNKTVITSLYLALITGVLIASTGVLICPWLYKITSTPAEVFAPAVSYTKIYFSGMIPSAIFNMTAGLLRATGDSRKPFYALAFCVTINIILDLLFTGLLGFGVKGAAWATFISQSASAVITLVLLFCSRKELFKQKSFVPQKNLSTQILKLGIPVALQSTFYSLCNIFLQSDINRFGTDTIAAWTAFCKIDAIFWTVTGAMGIAVTTFTGINYGAKLYDRIKKCLYSGMFICLTFTAICMIVFYFAGPAVIALFTRENAVQIQALKMLNFFIPVWWTYISIEILSGVIRGTGNSFIPMIISLTGACLFRTLWLFTAVPYCFTINTVMAAYPVSWILTSVAFWIYWFKKGMRQG